VRYFVYRTTCILNGKYYIGVHSEQRKSDGYIGCGVCSDGTAISLKKKKIKSAFIDSVIKHGYKNFTREIIQECDSSEEAYQLEVELVNKETLKDKLCLNIKLGGIGGKTLSSCKPIEILNCKTGEVIRFESHVECALFLGLKNVSGKKRFLKNSYILKGEEVPISIKQFNENPIYFYDIYEASKFIGVNVHSLKRLMSKERKSCKGWFLEDFDFNSSFYKNSKIIRKTMKNIIKKAAIKKKGFPDVSGDGKVTKKDILIAKGVLTKKKK